MYFKDKETKIINFIEDFGCVKEEQLKTLFDIDKSYLRNILHTHYINKKGDIYILKQRNVNIKMIAALDVLCQYKGRFKQFYRNFEPVYLSFLSKDNLVYNIIVSEKADEKGIVKVLKNKPSGSFKCDKLILLFEDTEMFNEIETEIPYLYCTYPEVKVINSVT